MQRQHYAQGNLEERRPHQVQRRWSAKAGNHNVDQTVKLLKLRGSFFTALLQIWFLASVDLLQFFSKQRTCSRAAHHSCGTEAALSALPTRPTLRAGRQAPVPAASVEAVCLKCSRAQGHRARKLGTWCGVPTRNGARGRGVRWKRRFMCVCAFTFGSDLGEKIDVKMDRFDS